MHCSPEINCHSTDTAVNTADADLLRIREDVLADADFKSKSADGGRLECEKSHISDGRDPNVSRSAQFRAYCLVLNSNTRKPPYKHAIVFTKAVESEN